MKKLIILFLLFSLVSCKNETLNTVSDKNTNVQLRIQFVGQNGDTTYSETKILR
jgi:hypothetical protein